MIIIEGIYKQATVSANFDIARMAGNDERT
jgi:hypothetical protein